MCLACATVCLSVCLSCEAGSGAAQCHSMRAAPSSSNGRGRKQRTVLAPGSQRCWRRAQPQPLARVRSCILLLQPDPQLCGLACVLSGGLSGGLPGGPAASSAGTRLATPWRALLVPAGARPRGCCNAAAQRMHARVCDRCVLTQGPSACQRRRAWRLHASVHAWSSVYSLLFPASVPLHARTSKIKAARAGPVCVCACM